MVVLRLALAITWIYGGWYKAVDPGYLDPQSPRFFGTDISQYIGQSPISFLLKFMASHAVVGAWFVMLSEFAVGICVLFGIALQFASIGGASIALTLWLSVSAWQVPYFAHSEIVWLIGWIVFFMMLRWHEKSRGHYAEKLFPNLTDSRELVRIGFALILSVALALIGLQLR
jgi:uncharacterized membrane protein YphA (DoxX/SURF4 family)